VDGYRLVVEAQDLAGNVARIEKEIG